MNLVSILPYIQIGLAVILSVAILLQQSDASVSGTFGGSFSENAARSRRGFERTLFQITIVIAIPFALSAIASLWAV